MISRHKPATQNTSMASSLWSNLKVIARYLAVTSLIATPGAVFADPDSDWLARSTDSGVVKSTRFDTLAEISSGLTDSNGNTWSTADHVSWQQSGQASGNGSMRFDILRTDGEASGLWRWPFGREFGTGDTFYVQFRQFMPAFYTTHKFLNSNGWKQIIISNNKSSNQFFEVVLENSGQRGYVQGYNRDSNLSYTPWQTTVSTFFTGGDITYQNQIDRGFGNATALASRRTHGGLFSYSGTHPDPESGAFIYYPDEWVTYYLKISPGGFGTGVADTRIEMWAARSGATEYTKLNDIQTDLGPEDGEGLFDALWLLPYSTNRSPDPTRQDTYTLYDEVIVSTSPIAVPNAGPVVNIVRPASITDLNAN